MEKHDITNVNYITEKDNMLIFARLGVMKNNQDNVFIYHFPLILVQINFFSSKNIENIGWGTTQTNRQMTKEKNLLAFNICDCCFAPHQDISV